MNGGGAATGEREDNQAGVMAAMGNVMTVLEVFFSFITFLKTHLY